MINQENRILKNPSLFTEDKPSKKGARKDANSIKERSLDTHMRFQEFYNTQLQFMDNKQQKILGKLEDEERAVEKMRQKRNTFQLISKGTRKILNRSKKRSVDPSTVAFTVEHGKPVSVAQPSSEFGTNSTFDNNFAYNTVHDRLYMEKSVNDEKKKHLIEKYNREQMKSMKATYIKNSRERKDKNLTKLKLSRSAQHISQAIKNAQQSSQNGGGDNVDSELSKNFVDLKTISYETNQTHELSMRDSNLTLKNACDKLYNDAKRRQNTVHSIDHSHSRGRGPSQNRNLQSEKYLTDLFNKDFEKALLSRDVKIVNKEMKSTARVVSSEKSLHPDLKNYKLNYYHSSELLKDLGFMYTDEDHNDKPDERMLFVDFWRILKEEEKQKATGPQNITGTTSDTERITVYNIKKMLLAIQGFIEFKKKSSQGHQSNMHAKRSRE